MLQPNSSFFAYIWTNCFKLTKFEAEKTTNISVYSLITHRRQNVRNKINVVFCWVAGLLSSSRDVRTGQESNFAIMKFFHERTGPNFYHLLYDPNTGFRYIFGQFRVGVFEKNPLLHTPISAEKRN